MARSRSILLNVNIALICVIVSNSCNVVFCHCYYWKTIIWNQDRTSKPLSTKPLTHIKRTLLNLPIQGLNSILRGVHVRLLRRSNSKFTLHLLIVNLQLWSKFFGANHRRHLASVLFHIFQVSPYLLCILVAFQTIRPKSNPQGHAFSLFNHRKPKPH